MTTNRLLAFFLFAVFIALISILFWNQYTIPNIYFSDWRSHVGFSSSSKIEGGYSLLHFLVFHTSRAVLYIIPYLEFANVVNFVMNLYVTFSVIMTYYVLKMFYLKNYFSCIVSSYVSLSLLLVSMIVLKYDMQDSVYASSGTPNPWHNPTYLFARPFSLLFFAFVVKRFLNYTENTQYGDLFLLSFIGVLSTWSKPSFILTFVPVLGIYVLFVFLTKKKRFKFVINYLILIIPSLFVVYLIKTKTFDNENKVVISLFEVWSHYSKNIPYSILILLLFPLYIFLSTIKYGISNIDFLVYGNLIVAILYFIILAETGDRKFDGNFAWGVMIATFISFVYSLQKISILKERNKVLYFTGVLFYFLHLISGLFYFVKISLGGHYM
jgi:hypothetical protein